jgi:hypothetical protein
VRGQLLHRLARTTSRICWATRIRGDAPRRDLPALCRGGRDLQPGLPGLADPLPVRSGADHQDQRHRRHQHAGPGQAGRAKILQSSTSEVYGDPTIHPQTEDYRGNVNPLGPRACYDEGKRCAETLFFDYHRQHNLRIKVARIFNTYGPRMHPNDGRVVSNFIVQALRGEDITLYGDGSQTRAFCYVDDLIDGLIRLMAPATDVTGPINIGNPHEIPVRELAERVIALTGSSSPRAPAAAAGRSAAALPGHLGTQGGPGRRPEGNHRLLPPHAGLRRCPDRGDDAAPWKATVSRRWPADASSAASARRRPKEFPR